MTTLKKQQIKYSWSYKEIAKRTDISANAVSRILNGKSRGTKEHVKNLSIVMFYNGDVEVLYAEHGCKR